MMRFFTLKNDNIINSSNMMIKKDEIDIWIIEKKIITLEYKKLVKSLSKDEAKHIYSNDFLLSRWFLRQILSIYTKIAPEKLCISYTKTGKPFLQQEGENKIYFNLTHSSELLVCAVSFGKKIGVDIEKNRHINRIDNLISRFFSVKERSYLFSLPKNERMTEFLWYWVAKEAYLKSTGDGISSIDEIEVSRKNSKLIIHRSKINAKCKNLQLHSFVPHTGHVACVVCYE